MHHSVRFACRVSLCSVLCLLSTMAAASPVTIQSLQMPAWLVRDGHNIALEPGAEMTAGDAVKTGKGGRILLNMEEGSLVKVGEQGSLALPKLKAPTDPEGFFEATIRVLKGAFRFTTTAAGQNRRRDISVNIGTITAGIRGTDIWGKSADDKDLVCLIEGKITTQRTGEPAFSMQDPLSFYVVPKDQPALPVGPVTDDQLAKWAAETELLDGLGVVTTTGRWSVILLSLRDENAAAAFSDRLNQAGYAAHVVGVDVKGAHWFRVSINRFASKKDARSFASYIDGQYGVNGTWLYAAQ